MAAARRFIGLVALASSLGACGGGTPTSTIPIPSGAVELRVADLKFAPSHLSVEADQPFVLYFASADSVPHNVVIAGPDGTRIFVGDIISGSTQQVDDVPALAPGTYKLLCDIHLEMSGTMEAVVRPTQAVHPVLASGGVRSPS